MNKKHFYPIFVMMCAFVISSCTHDSCTTSFNQDLAVKEWNASWIAAEKGSQKYGVYHFRKVIVLNDVPEHFIIHISADNRYILYVNGQHIVHGPATGDLKHYQFETADIASFLRKDSNVIAAVVWNYGDHKPWGQLSAQTAFICQGNTDKEEILNTDNSWKVIASEAYSACIPSNTEFAFGQGTGAYEQVDFSKYLWGWNNLDFNDTDWKQAVTITKGRMTPSDSLWVLVQRTTPPVEYKDERIEKVVWCKGADAVPFIEGNKPMTIPAHTTVSILLDKSHVTTSFPELVLSGGIGSCMKITYNECLYTDTTRKTSGNSYKKGNRGKTEGMFMLGLYDRVFPDGGKSRVFQPLAFRTYRFLQMDITTQDEPLVIEDYKEHFTAYPFELKASFCCNDTVLNQLFLNGWRSVRLCSHSTYQDCPYYEQLQYFGDLNVTSRVSSYLSGDMRLVKQALLHGLYSMEGNELILDAYPQTPKIIIPSFAISWIDILGFYGAYTADTAFVKTMMPAVKQIMTWYESKLDTTCYLLGPMPHWNFIDCTKQWPWVGHIDGSCEPPGTKEGHSAALTLQYLYGLQKAEALSANMGDMIEAEKYHSLSQKVKRALGQLCWDGKRSLFADTPEKNSFSQHTNYLALATGIVPGSKVDEFIKHVNSDHDLVQASLQFRAYLHMGLKKYDRVGDYTKLVDPWRALISMGCTTFPEYPSEDNRSETHAWTTFPVLEMLTMICGIQPQGLGFSSVLIEPNLGSLQWAEGSFPHKNGLIKVKIVRSDSGCFGNVELPTGLDGILKCKNKSLQLHSGKQDFKF